MYMIPLHEGTPLCHDKGTKVKRPVDCMSAADNDLGKAYMWKEDRGREDMHG